MNVYEKRIVEQRILYDLNTFRKEQELSRNGLKEIIQEVFGKYKLRKVM